jgi:predicted metalloprotease with PDZ domain
VQDFFGRYVQGRETIDFRPLMARAGLVVRPQAPGRAWLGAVALDASAAGARVTSLVPFGSPLYDAGVAQDDRIVSIDEVAIDSQRTLTDVLGRLTPGTNVRLQFVRRGGESVVGMLTPVEDPRIEIVPLEGTGGALSDAQRAFRAAWLGSRQSQPGR